MERPRTERRSFWKIFREVPEGPLTVARQFTGGIPDAETTLSNSDCYCTAMSFRYLSPLHLDAVQ